MKLALFAFLAPVALSKQLCGKESYFPASPYEFNNNAYNEHGHKGHQCLYIDSAQQSHVEWHVDWSWDGHSNAPISYPYSGLQIDNPQTVEAIGKIQTKCDWGYSNKHNIRADVAYDLFTASYPTHPKSYGDFEMMIWLDRYGGIQPLGSHIADTHIDGVKWHVWNGSQPIMGTEQQTYTFLAAKPQHNFNGDVKDFFNYLAKTYAYPAESQYLITMQFGTEPFSGTGQLNVNSWSASIN